MSKLSRRPAQDAVTRALRSQGLASMRTSVTRFADIDDGDWALLREHIVWIQLAAKQPFVRPGELPTQVGFLVQGVMRIGYDRRDGRSFTKAFLAEGDFVGAADSLASREPTRLRIEAVTGALLACLPAQAWRTLFDRSSRWERVGRCLAEQLCLKKIRREASLLMDTPRERYREFVASHPDVDARVPGYLVASYLGIAPETLSRFRKARVQRAS